MDKYIITRKIKLFPIGDKEEIDRVYKYLRDGIEAQNKAMNEYMSALYVTTMMEICKEDRKLLQTLFQRVSDSKLGSGYDKNIHLPKGLPMGGTIQRKVSNDFFMDMKKGLLYGNISLRNYKKDNTLLVHVDYIRPQKFSEKKTGLYHNYKTDDEFVKHCYDSDFEVLIGFANHIIFKCIFGNPHKSLELRNILSKSKYIILNSDKEMNVEAINNLKLIAITYGFNSKCTFTVSSITENNIIICLQRSIKNIKNEIIEPQEYILKNEENIEKYAIIATGILKILYE